MITFFDENDFNGKEEAKVKTKLKVNKMQSIDRRRNSTVNFKRNLNTRTNRFNAPQLFKSLSTTSCT